jgi:hypothetical protein
LIKAKLPCPEEAFVEPLPLPPLEVLVEAADAGLHPWVKEHFPTQVRKEALAEELRFWITTGAMDLSWAANFRSQVPDVGEPVESYLAKWLPLADGGSHVLIGPRYLGLDPEWPFVAVAASDRPLVPADQAALVSLAREKFAAFSPRFVMVTAFDPAGSWPGSTPEMRLVTGLLDDLRRRPVPRSLRTEPRRDTGIYEDYVRIHQIHVESTPIHARYARCESREDLQELAEMGFLFDVFVESRWAGLLAARPGAVGGMPGAVVVELILDHPYRGQGYGPALGTLLARALPLAGDQALFGTIHYENKPAYRAALGSGRVDVGGEVVIPI